MKNSFNKKKNGFMMEIDEDNNNNNLEFSKNNTLKRGNETFRKNN